MKKSGRDLICSAVSFILGAPDQTWLDTLGYSRDEVIGKSFADFLHPEWQDHFKENFPRFKAIGEILGVEFEMVKKNGDLIRVSFTGKISSYKKGDFQQTHCIFQDITERKRAEEELKQKTAQLEATIRSLPDGYIVYDMDRSIIQMNAIAEEIFAYTSKERVLSYEERVEMLQIQTETGDPFPSEHTPSYRALLGETVHNVVMRIVRPHRHYWLSVSSAPIVDSNGSMLGAVMRFNDITERKEAENELAAVNRELEAFSYSVSHDLRAPLHVISSLSSSLRRSNAGQLDNVTKEYLLRIEAGVKNINHLINDIMRLSKIGRHKMVMEEIDFSCMAKAFANELQQQHQEKHVEIHIADDLMARGDAQLLTSAVANLLRNAWKYTSKEAEACIEVDSCEKDGKQVFFIRDNGTGFPMEQADSLFRPFQRLHSESEFPRTGIGLAIVQRVIKRHGGEIWTEGEVGKGAVFYFTLCS